MTESNTQTKPQDDKQAQDNKMGPGSCSTDKDKAMADKGSCSTTDAKESGSCSTDAAKS